MGKTKKGGGRGGGKRMYIANVEELQLREANERQKVKDEDDEDEDEDDEEVEEEEQQVRLCKGQQLVIASIRYAV